MRILLVKTSSLGDVVHNLPVASDIRRHFPDARIDWAVEESFAEIPRLHPAVTTVVAVAPRRWRKSLLDPATRREIAALRARLADGAYDFVIDTQGLLKSALIACLRAGPAHRPGLGQLTRTVAASSIIAPTGFPGGSTRCSATDSWPASRWATSRRRRQTTESAYRRWLPNPIGSHRCTGRPMPCCCTPPAQRTSSGPSTSGSSWGITCITAAC